jgi:hypothetical protein
MSIVCERRIGDGALLYVKLCAKTTKRHVLLALETLLFTENKIDVHIAVRSIDDTSYQDERMHQFAQSLQRTLTRLTNVRFQGYQRGECDEHEEYVEYVAKLCITVVV